MNYREAKHAADELLAILAPACVRIEVAGSLRRCKADNIHDIEFVAIGGPQYRNEFGRPAAPTALHALTDDMLRRGLLAYRHDKNGRKAWGAKFRRCLWRDRPVDLFIVSPAKWGMAMVIRTGDAEFSHLIVTPEALGGAMPTLMRATGFRLARLSGIDEGADEILLETPEEADVFTMLGLPWIEPRDRNIATLRKSLNTTSRYSAKEESHK